MRRIGIGMVGCGVVCTRDLLPNLILPDAQDRLDPVAVCDVVEARARETAERFGARRYYSDIEALVRDPEIEIVGITTPVRHHLPVALAAIEAGKHVYVQKTMTETVAAPRRRRLRPARPDLDARAGPAGDGDVRYLAAGAPVA